MMAAGIVLGNVASPRLAARTGPAVPLVAGMLVTAAALAGLAWAGPVWRTALLLIPFGAVGVSIPALITALLESVPGSQAGLAGGVLNASRQLGSALGVALFGALVSGTAAGAGREAGRGWLAGGMQFAQHGSSFRGGMVASLVIGMVLLTAAAVANAAVFRRG